MVLLPSENVAFVLTRLWDVYVIEMKNHLQI